VVKSNEIFFFDGQGGKKRTYAYQKAKIGSAIYVTKIPPCDDIQEPENDHFPTLVVNGLEALHLLRNTTRGENKINKSGCGVRRPRM